jgi:hypothetical protein
LTALNKENYEKIIQLFLCLFIELISLFDNLRSLFNVFQILEGIRIAIAATSIEFTAGDPAGDVAGHVTIANAAEDLSKGDDTGNVVTHAVIRKGSVGIDDIAM